MEGEFRGEERHVSGGGEDGAACRRMKPGFESGERALPAGPGVRDAAGFRKVRVRAAVSDDDDLRAKPAQNTKRPFDELRSADVEGEFVGSGEPEARSPGEDDPGYVADLFQRTARVVAGFFRERILARSVEIRCSCEAVCLPRDTRFARARSTAALWAFRSVSHAEKRPEEIKPR